VSNSKWTFAPESPFLDEAFFPVQPEEEWEPSSALAESPFQKELDLEREFFEGESGVISEDNRVRITPTTGVPWRWICRVEVKGNRESQPAGGTGVLISNRHVLTAAHVIYEAWQNMQNFSIEVIPGLDYGDEPFGRYAVSTKPKVPAKYRPDAADRFDYDYAILQLDSAAGKKTFGKDSKALCYWGSPDCGEGSVFARRDPMTLNAKAALTAGYPGTRGGKKLMCAAGMLHSASRQRRTMWITADTTKGQSGSPIWIVENGKCHLVGIAVGAGGQSNVAVRVTRELIRQLRTWISEDGETPSMIEAETPAEAEAETAETLEERFDPTSVPADVKEQLEKKEWEKALELAINAGWHDEYELTNLLFFARHSDLPVEPLTDKTPNHEQLGREWNKILKVEVRPAVQKASEEPVLKVAGSYVAERDPAFSGAVGKKFKDLVEWAAKETDLNPGFLAAVLLAEFDTPSLYLGSGEVSSFVSGTDDFFAPQAQLRANVPAFSKVKFDQSKKTTNVNEHGRTVTTIPFQSGRDAALATAVYLKYGEIKLRKAVAKQGGDFDALPAETRFALTRIAMGAGHGGISPDGDLIRFKKKGDEWVPVKKGESGGVLTGTATRLQSVIDGKDILIRKNEPRRDPSNSGHVTDRNATILAAQAIHLSNWIFNVPLSAPAPPQTENFVFFDQAEMEADEDFEEREDEPSFEMDIPTVDQADLKTRIKEYYDKANAEYTLKDGTTVHARPQFRYAKAGGTEEAIEKVKGILGKQFEKDHPNVIHMAAYGRAKPSDIQAINQGLIDNDKLPAGSATADDIRNMQHDFKMGIDCAGYVQLAFIYAFTGSDDDPPSLRRSLGLDARRGDEVLSDLPRSHFKKVPVTDARTGDLFVLHPRAGDADRAVHTMIVLDHTVSGTEHSFVVHASWGTELYGPQHGGVEERTLKFDTATGEWWDIDPRDGSSEAWRNTVGPYKKHIINGMFRPIQK
jgi:V8-like Glu-specific endopeptidase